MPRSFMRARNCFCSSGDIALEAFQHARRRVAAVAPAVGLVRRAALPAGAAPPARRRPACARRRRGCAAAATPLRRGPRRCAAAPPLAPRHASAGRWQLGRHRLTRAPRTCRRSGGSAAPRSARAATSVALGDLHLQVRRHARLELQIVVRHVDDRAVGRDVLHDDRLQPDLRHGARGSRRSGTRRRGRRRAGPAGSGRRRPRRCSR